MTSPLHRFIDGPPRLHYLEWLPRQGPPGVPVLFIHGFVSHAAHWLPTASALAAGNLRTAPRRCIALDLRGRGDSEAPSQGYSVADHAGDIARVVAAAGLERFALVAFSLGVAYAAAYAARAPERVLGFVAGDYPARSRRFGATVAAQYLAEPTAFPDWTAARAHFRQRAAFSDEYWEQVRGDLLRQRPDGSVARHYSPDALRALLAETEAGDWWDTLAAPGRPLLVLQGGESKALSAESVARYQGLGARVVTAPGAGHDVFAAVPGIALRELQDLLFWLDASPVR